MLKDTRSYYDATAARYDDLHGGEQNLEHIRALERGWRVLPKIVSALDVGCGTGRALEWINKRDGTIDLFGIDPSEGLLSIARAKVPRAVFKTGKGDHLPFEDSSIDLVLATGIMHHVDDPTAVIKEMFRVARTAVLISDHNNFAFSGDMARRVRLILYSLGLFRAAAFIKQGFRRQGYSAEDGWWYPYSLLDNHADITTLASEMFYIPTRKINSDRLSNFLVNQSHLAVVAFK